MSDISLEQWRAELERVMGRSGDEGMTAHQLAEAMGWHVQRMRRTLAILKAEGHLVRGTRLFERLDGTMAPLPVYSLRKVAKLPKAG